MNDTPEAENAARHHWLVAGAITFTVEDAEGVGRAEMNATITNNANFVTANMLGVAQQMMQAKLFEQIQDPTIRMISVHLQGVNYLGEMTAEQFYAPPPAETAEEGDTTIPATDEAVVASVPIDLSDPFLDRKTTH